MILINNTEFIQKEYPVGEQLLEFTKENLDAIYSNNKVDITWHYKDDKDFMTLYFIVQKIKGMEFEVNYPFVKKLGTLKIPYLPYARMDRTKEIHQFFSLKYVAKFINSLGFEKVIINDAHSDVALKLISNVENCNNIKKLIEIDFSKGKNLKDYVICFPDKTAVKRYEELSSQFYGAIAIEKIRDFSTGKILSFDLKVLSENSDFDNKEVVIVDDICSYGGTFLGAIEKIRNRWCIDNFHLVVSHLEKAFYDGKLKDSPYLKSVTTSNSLDYNYKGVINE